VRTEKQVNEIIRLTVVDSSAFECYSAATDSTANLP